MHNTQNWMENNINSMNNVIFKSEALWGGDCNAMSSWKMPSILIEHRIMQNYSFNCAKIKISRRTSSITHNKQQTAHVDMIIFSLKGVRSWATWFSHIQLCFSTLHAQHFVRDGKIFFAGCGVERRRSQLSKKVAWDIYMYIGSVEEKEEKTEKREKRNIIFSCEIK